MKTSTTSLKAVARLGAAILGFAGATVFAADPGWYLGGNLGQSAANIDDGKITANLASQGLTTTSISDDDRELGFKVFGGYQFNPHFAIESGYFDPGQFGYTAQASPPGTQSGNLKLRIAFLDPVFYVPFTERLSLVSRVGATYVDAESSFSATGSATAPAGHKKRSLNYTLGAGLEYDVTPRFGLRAEVERYRIDDSVGEGNEGDIDMASLGLVFRFVAERPAAPAPVQPVAYVPPPPSPPPPVFVVVPAPARMVKYCTILDIEFEINLDEIQREEKEKLAVLGTFLNKYPDTTAVIEGHSDNVGSPEANMKLSQARADSVVEFLVSKHHIARSRLTAVGYGDTRPIGDNSTEIGKRQNRRIGAVIACARDVEGLTVVPAQITMALDMEFDQNKSEVKPEYRDQLAKVAAFLKANPQTTATVEGHASNQTGSAQEAMALSRRRADSVVTYLAENFGVQRSRLSAEGFGETRRTAYNTSAEGQKENRRVNIIINYPGSR